MTHICEDIGYGFLLPCKPMMAKAFSSCEVLAPKVHKNCLTNTYIRDDRQARYPVRENQISWSTPYPEYDPDDFTMPHILKGPVWADPNIRYSTKSFFVCSNEC